MNKKITRKKFFQDAIKYSAGAAAGITGLNTLTTEAAATEEKTFSWPWPYTKLDPEKVRIVAHERMYKMGCCYSVFAGILVPLQEAAGDPFTRIPPEMMSFGGGGIKNWGTICGALNGAGAVISLVCDIKSSGPIIDELMSWYSQSLFPTDTSNSYGEKKIFKAGGNIKALPQSKSGSPLCHVSVTRWCKDVGYAIGSPEQKERCARLSSDVAAKTVALLNDHQDGKFKAAFQPPSQKLECLDCHGPEKEVANVNIKMSCIQCHGEPHK